MSKEFRNTVTDVGQKAIKLMEGFLDGGEFDASKIKYASQMVAAALKVEHMNQVNDHSKKSMVLRLAKLLPVDEGSRLAYIAMTNPEIRPLLLSRPEETASEE